MKALETDEAAHPLPERLCVIRMRVIPEVMSAWKSALGSLRASVREELGEWEALSLLIRDFLEVWDNPETRRQRQSHKTLERDGWRCTAPACSAVGTGRLHEHHIVFLSNGGAEKDPSNLTTLCAGHHLGLLHEGRIGCTGRAPGDH